MTSAAFGDIAPSDLCLGLCQCGLVHFAQDWDSNHRESRFASDERFQLTVQRRLSGLGGTIADVRNWVGTGRFDRSGIERPLLVGLQPLAASWMRLYAGIRGVRRPENREFSGSVKVRSMRKIFLIAGASLIGPGLPANMILKESAADLFSDANLVVVATAKNVTPHTLSTNRHQRFDVIATVKGREVKSVEVFTETDIAEDHTKSCVPGKKYLLYLRHWHGPIWYAVDNQFGFVPLD